MSTITKELQTIRDRFSKSCVKLDILDSEGRPVGNYNDFIISFYEDHIRRLLEEQAKKIIGEDEPSFSPMGTGYILCPCGTILVHQQQNFEHREHLNYGASQRNMLRKEQRLRAGITDTQGKEDEEK